MVCGCLRIIWGNLGESEGVQGSYRGSGGAWGVFQGDFGEDLGGLGREIRIWGGFGVWGCCEGVLGGAARKGSREELGGLGRGLGSLGRDFGGVRGDFRSCGGTGRLGGSRGRCGGKLEVPGNHPPSPLPMTSPHLWVGMEKVISPPGGPQLPWPRPRPRPPGGSPGPGGPGGPLCREGASGVGRTPKTGGTSPQNHPCPYNSSSPK